MEGNGVGAGDRASAGGEEPGLPWTAILDSQRLVGTVYEFCSNIC